MNKLLKYGLLAGGGIGAATLGYAAGQAVKPSLESNNPYVNPRSHLQHPVARELLSDLVKEQGQLNDDMMRIRIQSKGLFPYHQIPYVRDEIESLHKQHEGKAFDYNINQMQQEYLVAGE